MELSRLVQKHPIGSRPRYWMVRIKCFTIHQHDVMITIPYLDHLHILFNFAVPGGSRIRKLQRNQLNYSQTWPSSKSYGNVKCAIEDGLIIAKLHLFSFVAGLLQPFFTCYQGDAPMIAFRSNDIKAVYRSLLELIVKPNLLKENATPLKIINIDSDEKKNLLNSKSVHLGFAAESESEILLDQNLLVMMKYWKCAKMRCIYRCRSSIQWEQLSYAVLRLSILIPYWEPKAKNWEERWRILFKKLASLKIIAFKTGDSALTQYSNFLENEVTPPKELFYHSIERTVGWVTFSSKIHGSWFGNWSQIC